MMAELSISALLIRFVLGGAAVVLATIVAKIVGQKAGGIFAAFPAVYLAALLTASIDFSGEALINYSILLSKGAIVGMVINIIMAVDCGISYSQKRLETWIIRCVWLLVYYIHGCCCFFFLETTKQVSKMAYRFQMMYK